MAIKVRGLSASLCAIISVMLACSPGGSSSQTQSPKPSATLTPKTTPTQATPSATSPALSPSATATGSAVSFAGKTVTIVVPAAAGGGGDIVARVYGNFLSRFLPGNPTIIVRDMPGGAGTIAANYVYSAKPDGLTLLIATSGPLIADLLNMSAARYDLLKMPAAVGVATGSGFYIKSGVISKPEDLIKAKGIVFGYNPGGTGYTFVVAKELLNIPTDKVVLGYSGGADALRAFLSGETNMTAGVQALYAESIAPMVTRGEVMVAFQSGLLDDKGNLIRDSALPPAPTPRELHETVYGKPPSGMAWDAYKGLIALASNYDKVLFLPPGTPDNITRAFFDATDRMVRDAEFRRNIGPLAGESAKWMSGQAFDQEFKLNFRMEPAVVDWLKALLRKYGVVVD